MAEHTPGPWMWVDPPESKSTWGHQGPDLMAGDREVVSSWGYDADGLDVSDADARLIVAAPDLLQALQMLLMSALVENPEHRLTECREPSCTAARAAVVKALGGEDE